MRARRYPIHGEPGKAWMLVFDDPANRWCVEVICAGSERRRLTLTEFEASVAGEQLAAKVSAAVELASQDA